MKLLAVDDARARMLARVTALRSETVPLGEAIGRVLAEDVLAMRDQPPFAASAMDGWAVRAADAPGDLAIIGESAAGQGFSGVVLAGQAVRIFTGAAVPQGCEAIVIQEDATRDGERVRVPAVTAGHFVRPQGGDFRAGDVLLAHGVRLDPWRLALAASAGRDRVQAARRPVVALLSTGEEIVEAPATPGPFQIYDSGGPALAALMTGWGARVIRARPVADELDAVIVALRDARCDLVVTLGGASVGDHDLVRAAGEALELDLVVASLAMRPGKPTFFGTLGDGRLMLGLPGNPASALVCAELFLRPLLNALQGAEPGPEIRTAQLATDLPANGPREHWMRARLSSVEGVCLASPYGDQDSSLVSVFAGSDALLRRPAGVPPAAAGDVVEIIPLPRA